MKAIEINGSIKKYNSIPKSWGGVFAGFNLLSDEALETYGFYDVVEPDGYDSQIHDLGEIEFDADNSVFTYPKSNKTWSQSLAELKTQKISNLKSSAGYELAKTDWYITREAELGTSVPDSITTERAAIRSKVDTIESEINALTTKANVVKYTYKGWL